MVEPFAVKDEVPDTGSLKGVNFKTGKLKEKKNPTKPNKPKPILIANNTLNRKHRRHELLIKFSIPNELPDRLEHLTASTLAGYMTANWQDIVNYLSMNDAIR